jgi:hypothetical protein
MKTPGSAMEERRSCHSAVFLMSLLWMTLEIIVPENTPLGKVTKSYKNLRSVKGKTYSAIKPYHAPHVPISDFQ